MKSTITFLMAFTFLTFSSVNLVSAQTTSITSLTPIEQLGKKLFFDKISNPDHLACADCHGPSVGFTGPISGFNKKGAVYPGAVPQRFGNRKPPSAAYATLSPIFHYDPVEELFVGGNFWDGRATGEHLGNPAADQALGPFLNPVEQNNAAPVDVLKQVAKSKYAWLWMEVWGEPLSYATPDQIALNYDRVGLAIASYEGSVEVNSFSSKYDYYLQGMVDLTDKEMMGLELFNGAAMCNACHVSEPGPNGEPPLFTDFTFDNLGVPKNPDNPFYNMDEVYLPGSGPINPLGDAWIDYGLGEFLANSGNPLWESMAEENMGKQKVPTLRNVDKRPGDGFTKAFMHNGVFKSLKEVVHFYNTRDVGMWPPPEVAENVNMDELGDLGLTNAEEKALVAFMQTLSDGYKLPKSAPAGTEPVCSGFELRISGINPFSYKTQLQYSLPVQSDVELSVFNLAGEKIATLVSGVKEAGEYMTDFVVGNLNNGIYIVCLNAGDNLISKKVTLLR